MREVNQATSQDVALNRPASDRNHVSPPPISPRANGSVTSPLLPHKPPGSNIVKGRVHNVNELRQIDELLNYAKDSCAVIFFTSATCPPCKLVYPAYDELAEEAGTKAILLKVDLSKAYEAGARYQVRATPTFMAFLRGQKENEWVGADESKLRGNVKMLIQMAWPHHPHRNLRLPSLQRTINTPIIYKKAPPMDKLVTKLGQSAQEPSIASLIDFIKARTTSIAADAHVPDLGLFSNFIRTSFSSLPEDIHFIVIDLVRVAFIDPRVSGFFAVGTQHQTLTCLLSHVRHLESSSYSLRLVTLQLACNLFTSPFYPEQVMMNDYLRSTISKLITTCLYDEHVNVRIAAASLLFNVAAYNHNHRFQELQEKLHESDVVELAASVLEAIREESKSVEALHIMLYSIGLLAYSTPLEGELADLCKVLGASEIIQEKMNLKEMQGEKLIKEVGVELFGKGFP